MKNALSGVVWVFVYLFFCLLPLALAIGQPNPAGRPFLVEFSVALGFVGLSILALQFALIARFKVVAAPFGIDALLRYHRQISYVALAFVVAHPVLLFIADSKYWPLLKVWSAPWRARFAFTSVVLLLVLIALSVWRKRLRLSYEWWQASHGIIAVLVVLFALLHASLVGFYVTGIVRHVVYDGSIGALIFLLAWIRIISPTDPAAPPVAGGRRQRRGRQLGDAGDRAGRSRRVPVRPGPVRLDHDRPLAVLDHPASVLVLLDGRPATRRQRRDDDQGGRRLHRHHPAVRPGARVYVDGPHGVFSMDRRQAPGYVFIAGGIGVTPLYSMLLTMREREDVRPVTLLYANAVEDDIVFRDELAALDASMPNLEVVYVLDRPPDGWHGESGRITAELLQRRLPAQFLRYEYLICGPEVMMDAMEDALIAVGVPFRQVSTERLDMV